MLCLNESVLILSTFLSMSRRYCLCLDESMPILNKFSFNDYTVLLMFLLFNGISTFVGYSMPKPSFKKKQQWCYLTYSWKDEWVHAFSKGICLKVNIIILLWFCSPVLKSLHHGDTPLILFFCDVLVYSQVISKFFLFGKKFLISFWYCS